MSNKNGRPLGKAGKESGKKNLECLLVFDSTALTLQYYCRIYAKPSQRKQS